MINTRVADSGSVPFSGMRLVPSHGGVEPVPTGVLAVSTDPHGVVTWCNPAVGALVGKPCAALIGHPFPLGIFDRDQLEGRAAAAGVPFGPEVFLLDPSRFGRRRGAGPRLGDLDRRRSSRGGRPDHSSSGDGGQNCRWNVVGADGARRVVSLTVRSFSDKSGGLLGYFAHGVDVTEEQQTSRLLAQALLSEQEATRRLAELDQLRSDFVVTASHELRTPLTNILGFVELLEDQIDDPERRPQFMSAIRRNVVRLQDLAEDLLILSTANAHRVGPLVRLDLRDVVGAVRARLRGIGEAQGVVPEFVCPEHPVEVLGDASRLELVVLHLVENALKFTPPGGGVACRVAMSAGEATIEVSDTGSGVPGSELPHLLSPFFRGAAAREEAVPGSGLGLSIVAAVVKEHHGRLIVSGSEPHGSLFTVCLPHPNM